MEWKNLQSMRCPKCGKKLSEGGIGYLCPDMLCDFMIGYGKFKTVINDAMMPKKPKYDPDKIDRSNWEI